jgi:hypothetical protein
MTVRVYFNCLRKKLLGAPFNRTLLLQAVASAIGRSRDAVDYKFQNIDSVLSEADLPCLNNAVAANIQKLLRYVVRDTLADHAKVFELTHLPAAESVRDDDRHPVVHGLNDAVLIGANHRRRLICYAPSMLAKINVWKVDKVGNIKNDSPKLIVPNSSYLLCSRSCAIFGCLAVPVTATEMMAPASW